LDRKEFQVVYQPQIDSRTGRVFAVEALSRWEHPALGLLLPETFIPIAEETGLIAALSDWVLEQACTEIKDLMAGEVPGTRLAVNLSHRDLVQPNLASKVKTVLEHTGFTPSLLELELSENTIFRDMQQSGEVLGQLKQLGVRLAIDDFGVGYSTLSQLARLPIDTLKIDRQFAAQLHSSPNDAAIVNGIVTIAKSLGVDVVAEGVENKAQLDFYESLGCHRIQGWLFAEAVPADQLKKLILDGVARPQLQLKIS
jgi:EAL domain-containing protein (putative c-di-GMP-specific phosphodiesterase class I)